MMIEPLKIEELRAVYHHSLTQSLPISIARKPGFLYIPLPNIMPQL
jgi:hypothetical protein